MFLSVLVFTWTYQTLKKHHVIVNYCLYFLRLTTITLQQSECKYSNNFMRYHTNKDPRDSLFIMTWLLGLNICTTASEVTRRGVTRPLVITWIQCADWWIANSFFKHTLNIEKINKSAKCQKLQLDHHKSWSPIKFDVDISRFKKVVTFCKKNEF